MNDFFYQCALIKEAIQVVNILMNHLFTRQLDFSLRENVIQCSLPLLKNTLLFFEFAHSGGQFSVRYLSAVLNNIIYSPQFSSDIVQFMKNDVESPKMKIKLSCYPSVREGTLRNIWCGE